MTALGKVGTTHRGRSPTVWPIGGQCPPYGTVAPLGGAPDADVIAVKVLDSSNSFCCSSDVVAGMDWVLNNHPETGVVNMSLGTFALFAGDCDTTNAVTIAFATAVNALTANGTTVFERDVGA